jgi:hypothetical protein
MAVPENRTGTNSAVARLGTSIQKPSWLSAQDALRLMAYQVYDILYWNDVGNFQLTLRGDEEFPVYIPSARRIVNTFARYVGRDVTLDIQATDSGMRDACKLELDNLFRRERFWTKFHHEKKSGSIHGDWVIMLIGDPNKPEGQRISIKMVEPGKYFSLTNPEDDSERWGAQIMELVHVGDKDYVKVQEWLKVQHPNHQNYNPEAALEQPVPIQYSQILYELDNFQDLEKRKTFRVDRQPELLDGITALPLYHIRTNSDPNAKYGVSDLRGIERIFLAINQTATDQDVALALAGLGMYASDSSPVDPVTGQATDWIIGPKRVVEVPEGGKFERVSGVASVEPSIQHMDYLQEQAQSLFGINEIALGNVEVNVAESGIALALRMGPLYDASADRDREIGDILTQMFYDLVTMWFPTYERKQFGDSVVLPFFPPKVPVDKAAELERLNQLWTSGAISLLWYWEQLVALGYDIDPVKMQAEMAETGGVFQGDPTGDRLAEEASVGDEGA